MNDTKYFKINKKKQTVYEIRSNTMDISIITTLGNVPFPAVIEEQFRYVLIA